MTVVFYRTKQADYITLYRRIYQPYAVFRTKGTPLKKCLRFGSANKPSVVRTITYTCTTILHGSVQVNNDRFNMKQEETSVTIDAIATVTHLKFTNLPRTPYSTKPGSSSILLNMLICHCQVNCFVDNPGILMYGMMCVAYTTGIWLLLASFLELPVSTTHSTVGGIVGMAITYGGADCVVWYEEADIFPYLKGVSSIVASWAISPVFSGIIAVALFSTVRTFVLRSADSYKRAIITYPLLVMATVAVNGTSLTLGC